MIIHNKTKIIMTMQILFGLKYDTKNKSQSQSTLRDISAVVLCDEKRM